MHHHAKAQRLRDSPQATTSAVTDPPTVRDTVTRCEEAGAQAMSTDTNFSERFSAAQPERRIGEEQDYDPVLIRWIPIVVPLFAVFIALCVYFIDWMIF